MDPCLARVLADHVGVTWINTQWWTLNNIRIHVGINTLPHNAHKIAARLASGKCLLAVPLHDTPMSSKLLLLFSSIMLVLAVEL